MMCDCYSHKCCMCDNTIPMHIADFAYPRSEFTVWCHEHRHLSAPGAIHLEYGDEDWETGEVTGLLSCAILGPEVGGNDAPNTINGWCRVERREP